MPLAFLVVLKAFLVIYLAFCKFEIFKKHIIELRFNPLIPKRNCKLPLKTTTMKHFTLLSTILFFFLLSTGCQEPEPIDPCENITCNNGGTCIEGTCNCPDGFSGPQCEIEDLCITQNVECMNGGVCDEGNCDCPTGFIGESCENVDPDQLQFLLDEGLMTPLTLAQQGIPLEEIYGLNYADGIIFYVDLEDRLPDAEGMVVSSVNISTDADGECRDGDIEEIANASYSNANPGSFSSSGRLGQGKFNTDAILANCDDLENGAAKLCRDLGPEWFLPSMEEIWLVDQNLNVLLLFTDFDYYWTSSESSAEFFWAINAGERFDAIGTGSSLVYLRAVKEF